MASRSLEDLDPRVQARANAVLADASGRVDLLVYCTHRPVTEQARLYRKGRPFSEIQAKADELDTRYGRPGLAEVLISVGPQYGPRIVTHAGPGQSLHNYGLAFDAVPLEGGKPVWGTEADEDLALWRAFGDLVRQNDLEWAGDWESFTEFPHAQLRGADWRDLIRDARGDG
ncbi:M15 family metallopeptidase [Ectothiorhodospiraceae bacterium WFHF3C12]|nr:M15 family metallopeptidase [Ectothiorhodospiraceae bacterium WFHF3C12]